MTEIQVLLNEMIRPPQAPESGLSRVLVSGCINGPRIRFNQTNVQVTSPIWDRWVGEGRIVRFCAELAAGFPVPRAPAEIIAGTAEQVFRNAARVLEDNGTDVTDQFVRGAELAAEHALKNGCVAALLTDGSPSCGSTYVYNGGFAGGTKPGLGVVAQKLDESGIRVFSEEQLDEADRYLKSLD